MGLSLATCIKGGSSTHFVVGQSTDRVISTNMTQESVTYYLQSKQTHACSAVQDVSADTKIKTPPSSDRASVFTCSPQSRSNATHKLLVLKEFIPAFSSITYKKHITLIYSFHFTLSVLNTLPSQLNNVRRLH